MIGNVGTGLEVDVFILKTQLIRGLKVGFLREKEYARAPADDGHDEYRSYCGQYTHV